MALSFGSTKADISLIRRFSFADPLGGYGLISSRETLGTPFFVLRPVCFSRNLKGCLFKPTQRPDGEWKRGSLARLPILGSNPRSGLHFCPL